MDAVDEVIGCHNRPRITLTDGNLKASEIDLAGGPLGESFVDTGTVCLLRVHGEVLGRDTHIFFLHTVDIGGGNLTCQEGVFAVILEVSSTERVTVQVHARAEDHIAAVFLGLVADGLSYLSHEFGVPRGGETRADGEGGGIEGLIGTPAGGVDADTGRTVCQNGGRDAESRDFGCSTCSTCYEGSLTTYDGIGTEKVVGSTYEEFGFLFEGHGFEHLIDIIGTQFGLGIHCHCECGC